MLVGIAQGEGIVCSKTAKAATVNLCISPTYVHLRAELTLNFGKKHTLLCFVWKIVDKISDNGLFTIAHQL